MRRDASHESISQAGTRPARATFSLMDRLFLAMIVSGLLLAAVATSLLVATGGGNTVAVVNPPPAPILPTEKPRQLEQNRTRN
jgi:hypothetical protein